MSRKTLLVCLLAAAVSSGSAQEHPNLSGRWALISAQGGSWFGKEITVTQSATTLTVEFTTSIPGGIVWGNGQRSETTSIIPRKFVYALDGSETKNTDKLVVTDIEPSSKAAWDSDKLVIVTTSKAVVSEPAFERDDLKSLAFSQKTNQIAATHTVKQVLRLRPDASLEIEIISVYDTGLSSFAPAESRFVMRYERLARVSEIGEILASAVFRLTSLQGGP